VDFVVVRGYLVVAAPVADLQEFRDGGRSPLPVHEVVEKQEHPPKDGILVDLFRGEQPGVGVRQVEALQPRGDVDEHGGLFMVQVDHPIAQFPQNAPFMGEVNPLPGQADLIAASGEDQQSSVIFGFFRVEPPVGAKELVHQVKLLLQVSVHTAPASPR